MKKYIIFFIVCLCIWGCSSVGEKQSDRTVEISITSDTIERTLVQCQGKRIPSEWFCNYELIFFENKKDYMLSDVRKIVSHGDKIYVLNGGAVPQVYIFNEDGSCYGKVGKFGHGRGEYQNLSDMCINPRKGIILLLTYGNVLNVYDLMGKFLYSKTILKEGNLERIVYSNEKYYATSNHLYWSEKSPYLLYCFDSNLELQDCLLQSDQHGQNTPSITTQYLFADNMSVSYFDFYNHNIQVVSNSDNSINTYHIGFEKPFNYEDYYSNRFFDNVDLYSHINELTKIGNFVYGYSFIDSKMYCFFINLVSKKTFCLPYNDLFLCLRGADEKCVYSVLTPSVFSSKDEDDNGFCAIIRDLYLKSGKTVDLTSNYLLFKMEIRKNE